MLQRLEGSSRWGGEISRNTLSVHSLAIVLDFAPLRLPRHVSYLHPLALALSIYNVVHGSLLPQVISACA